MIEIPSKVFVMRPPGHDVTKDIASPNQHSQGFFKTQRDQCKIDRDKRITRRWTPTSYHVFVGRLPKSYLNSHLLIPKTFWLCNLVLGIQGKKYISHPTKQSLHPAVSIREHITRHLRKPCTSDLRKATAILAVAILPNYPPVLGDVEVISPPDMHRSVFDVDDLWYSGTVTIHNATTRPRSSTPRD